MFQQIKQFATYPVQSDYTPYSSHLKFQNAKQGAFKQLQTIA